MIEAIFNHSPGNVFLQTMETDIGFVEGPDEIQSERTDVISKLLTTLGIDNESSASKLELIGDFYSKKGELPVLDIRNILSLRLSPQEYQHYLKLSARLESRAVFSNPNKIFEFFEALSRPESWNTSFSIKNEGDKELFTQLKVAI